MRWIERAWWLMVGGMVVLCVFTLQAKTSQSIVGVSTDKRLVDISTANGGWYKVCVDDQCVDIRDVMRWMQHEIAALPAK